MGIRIKLGLDDFAYHKNRQSIQVIWDSDKVINGHMLVVGDSGTGKSYTLRKIINDMLNDGATRVRFHVFDVHGDIDIPGASVVKFSETTEWGFNPLRVNPDPDFGGVRKAIQNFINGVNKTSRKLGTKQEAVLRYLLQDLFLEHGYVEEDPRTWVVLPEDNKLPDLTGKENRIYLNVPYEERMLAKEIAGRALEFDTELKCWWVPRGAHTGKMLRWGEKIWGKRNPTLADAVRFASRKLEGVFLGVSAAAVNRFNEVNAKAAAYHRKVSQSVKKGGDNTEEVEKLQKELDVAVQKAVESYEQSLHAVRNGREMAEVLKYDSVDVLKSVYERLCNLTAIGIFRPRPAPFDRRNPVWRYDIKSLSPDEKLLFVFFHLEQQFSDAVQMGIAPNDQKIRHVIVLDEAHNYFNDDEDNILNKIAKEARKYGVGMICASQSPTHFSVDFLANVALKIILPIDPTYWDNAGRKLLLTRDDLRFLIPRQTALVQMKEIGKSNTRFIRVKLQ